MGDLDKGSANGQDKDLPANQTHCEENPNIVADFAEEGLFENTEFNSTAGFHYKASDAFQLAIDYVNNEHFITDMKTKLKSYVYTIADHDAYGLAKYVCDTAMAKHSMIASLGVKKNSLREYMQIASQRKAIPYFELSPAVINPKRFMVTYMYPDPLELTELIHLLILNEHPEWNWDKAFVVYESSEALTTYVELLALHRKTKLLISSFQKEVGGNYTMIFESIADVGYHNIIVDCSLSSISTFLDKALEMQMLTKEYHYHFTSLDLHVLELKHYSYGGATITWSQIIQMRSYEKMSSGVKNFDTFFRLRNTVATPKQYFTTYNALLVDSMVILAKSIDLAIMHNMDAFTSQPVACYNHSDTWMHGPKLERYISKHEENHGMTGRIKFNHEGKRINYTVYVMKLKKGGGIEQIGEYSPPAKNSKKGHIHLYAKQKTTAVVAEQFDSYKHQVLNITTILEPPYLIQKNNPNGETLHENERFEGYLVDLMERIAEEAKESHDLDLKYRFKLVADEEYGVEHPETGKWNGMVGELLDKVLI
ncbi:glutamate receptor ionotropic, kainate 3-like [Watersipora subatra]|uniref:glutamate receptor ionotropic, kainate 3-like n=1 Tax=Watersipora subatra TaxID=2589382 RepID=UPI00355BE2A0